MSERFTAKDARARTTDAGEKSPIAPVDLLYAWIATEISHRCELKNRVLSVTVMTADETKWREQQPGEPGIPPHIYTAPECVIKTVIEMLREDGYAVEHHRADYHAPPRYYWDMKVYW